MGVLASCHKRITPKWVPCVPKLVVGSKTIRADRRRYHLDCVVAEDAAGPIEQHICRRDFKERYKPPANSVLQIRIIGVTPDPSGILAVCRTPRAVWYRHKRLPEAISDSAR